PLSVVDLEEADPRALAQEALRIVTGDLAAGEGADPVGRLLHEGGHRLLRSGEFITHTRDDLAPGAHEESAVCGAYAVNVGVGAGCWRADRRRGRGVVTRVFEGR